METVEREESLLQWEEIRNKENVVRREEQQKELLKEERQKELRAYLAQKEQKRLQQQQLLEWHAQLKSQAVFSLSVSPADQAKQAKKTKAFAPLPPIKKLSD